MDVFVFSIDLIMTTKYFRVEIEPSRWDSVPIMMFKEICTASVHSTAELQIYFFQL